MVKAFVQQDIGNIREDVSRNLHDPGDRKMFEIHADSVVTAAVMAPPLYKSDPVAPALLTKLGDSEELLLPGDTEAAG